jgi:hypothetical protein
VTRFRPPTDLGAAEELAPLRTALVELARADEARVLAAADADAADTLARADQEVRQLTAAARTQAADDAADLLARLQSRHDREARAVELRARRAAYDELVRRAHLAADQLAREPAVHDRLVGLARAALGPEASVRDDGDGGVVAELAGRRVEYSLRALADEAVAALLADREGEP